MPHQRKPGYARAAKGRKGFYAALAAFSDFTEFAEQRYYRPAPSDWFVVVSDIEGSTGAVGEGRYKDVNMVAAASIVAVLNVAGGDGVPFVFGGDGATMLVPPAAAPAVRTALAKLAKLAEDVFHMPLRVGMVPVAELEAAGRSVLVARFALSSSNDTALFAGGGAELAETLVKGAATAARYSVADPSADYEDLDLSGLSCRWEPLPSRNGVILSLLVRAADRTAAGEGTAYRAVVQRITDILGRTPDAGNPVTPEALRFRWPPRGLALEARAMAAGRPVWRVQLGLLGESLVQGVLLWFGLAAGGFDGRRYRGELRANADYRRFDDTLRLVIDCTPDQATAIAAFLDERHAAGEVFYGTHRSDAALMTCVVFSLEQSDHMHFIDGTDGGFTLAARQMKAQMAT